MKLHIVLQVLGLAGLALAALLLWNIGVAILIAALGLLAAGIALERDRTVDTQQAVALLRELERNG